MRIVLLLHERDVRRVYVCVHLSPCRDPRTAVVTRQAGVTHACTLRRQHSQLALSPAHHADAHLLHCSVRPGSRTGRQDSALPRQAPSRSLRPRAHTDAICPDLQV